MLSSMPNTPSPQSPVQGGHTVTMDDLAVLDQLTSAPHPPKFRRREAIFDPLIFAAAVSSGPHITRHHFHHDYFPTNDYCPCAHDSHTAPCETCNLSGDDSALVSHPPPAPKYVSQQKPRTERLRELVVGGVVSNERMLGHGSSPEKRRPSLPPLYNPEPIQQILKGLDAAPTIYSQPVVLASPKPQVRADFSAVTATVTVPAASSSRPALVVQCRARTRIPTPHGPVFLHLYHNNWDLKEHLAVVSDLAQLEAGSSELIAPPIRSRSLDSQWPGETEIERITRGAYVGRLSATSRVPSSPTSSTVFTPDYIPAPMVRIHSECFTGETIGSMRCDCGEQLDEAIRLISQPQTIRASSSSPAVTIPGRGAVIYMRQEGRGIGLLEKIKAYNLQDLGHDTVTANLLLGHGADERGYEIAAAIMRDLGLGAGGEAERDKGVRLLTNNPEKIEALEREGIRVIERVEMVPRSWKCGDDYLRTRTSQSIRGKDEGDSVPYAGQQLRHAGATLIGAGAAHGPELERYLRTKVQRMRHMIDLPPSRVDSLDASSASSSQAETAVHSPDEVTDAVVGGAKELAYKIALVSQSAASSDEDAGADETDESDDDDEEEQALMSKSLRSLRSMVASTPDLESDRGSVGPTSLMSRSASPVVA